MTLPPLTELKPEQFDTIPILRKLNSATRKLAELKGMAAAIPQQEILVNTLGLQEAKDSSAIENIVTTHDDLYRGDSLVDESMRPGVKEVLRYRQALKVGFDLVGERGLLTTNHILRIQSELEGNSAGFRKLPGTVLKDGMGRTVYTPPQDHATIVSLMGDLESFLNDPERFPADPLVKMALAHYQFESIHPFYDGNGRTGRIMNVLYLVREGLLETPLLYLSRHIIRTKSDYYRLLQAVRERGAWEEWVLYMLDAVEQTAKGAVTTVLAIRSAFADYRARIEAEHPNVYTQDLINILFFHPYTKIEFLERDLKISRPTAAKYLDILTAAGFVQKQKVGRTNYYTNVALYAILTSEEML